MADQATPTTTDGNDVLFEDLLGSATRTLLRQLKPISSETIPISHALIPKDKKLEYSDIIESDYRIGPIEVPSSGMVSNPALKKAIQQSPDTGSTKDGYSESYDRAIVGVITWAWMMVIDCANGAEIEIVVGEDSIVSHNPKSPYYKWSQRFENDLTLPSSASFTTVALILAASNQATVSGMSNRCNRYKPWPTVPITPLRSGVSGILKLEKQELSEITHSLMAFAARCSSAWSLTTAFETALLMWGWSSGFAFVELALSTSRITRKGYRGHAAAVSPRPTRVTIKSRSIFAAPRAARALARLVQEVIGLVVFGPSDLSFPPRLTSYAFFRSEQSNAKPGVIFKLQSAMIESTLQGIFEPAIRWDSWLRLYHRDDFKYFTKGGIGLALAFGCVVPRSVVDHIKDGFGLPMLSDIESCSQSRLVWAFASRILENACNGVSPSMKDFYYNTTDITSIPTKLQFLEGQMVEWKAFKVGDTLVHLGQDSETDCCSYRFSTGCVVFKSRVQPKPEASPDAGASAGSEAPQEASQEAQPRAESPAQTKEASLSSKNMSGTDSDDVISISSLGVSS